jgi:hypothetical protein
VFDFVGFGQTIEAAAEFDDLATFAQGIKRVGVHAERDEITCAKRAALVAESLECGIEIAGFHGG